MQLVSYNIQYGTGKDYQVDVDRIVSECRGADVIALQEVERFFARSGDVDQVAILAAAFADYHWVYGAGVDIGADERDADSRLSHRRRTFGNMLLSRFPIVSSRNHLLPKYGSVGSPMSIQRSALEGQIEFPGGRRRVYSVHLSHITSEERVDQIESMLAIHHGAVHEGFVVNGDLAELDLMEDIPDQEVSRDAIFLGDFNMMPDSPEYERMVGPLSPYGGRVTSPDGFVDAWLTLGNDPEAGWTSDIGGTPERLDYAFFSTALASRLRSCRVDTSAVGSDHQPLWIEAEL